MKIAVTSTGPTLDDEISPRFGRCPYFLIVDTDGIRLVEALGNPNISAGGGAGVQSAQLMADHDVKAILTGNCGPNAFQVFGAAGIDVIVGVSGSVREAVETFLQGSVRKAGSANVPSHHGMVADELPVASYEDEPLDMESRVAALEQEVATLKRQIAEAREKD